jgi:hypothetical protein
MIQLMMINCSIASNVLQNVILMKMVSHFMELLKIELKMILMAPEVINQMALTNGPQYNVTQHQQEGSGPFCPFCPEPSCWCCGTL